MRKKILLLDGDAQTAFVSPYDKGTVPVMADAGSATLLSFSDTDDTEWNFTFYTDGSGREALTIPVGGSERTDTEEDLLWKEYEDGSKRRNIDIYMDGFAIFRFVAMDVSKWLKKFIENKTINSSIDSFVPHQANMYMIKKLAKKLGIDWEHTWQSGDAVGNSASATVPATIAFDFENRLDKSKVNTVLISGFGAGFSASAGLITLDPQAYYKFFEYRGETQVG